jgi:MYXO-CTERM domain-containing protein
VILLGGASQAWSYSLHSGLTEGCHEKLTRAALLRSLPTFDPDTRVPQPTSDLWRSFAQGLIRVNRLKDDFPQIEEPGFQLLLISMIIGVRSPDTEGHAITNLTRLRQIHADPDASGQYAHALRGPDDDGPAGDVAAIMGTRRTIIDLVIQSAESQRKPPSEQIVTVPLYFDFYGVVDIEVWEPAYLIGRALHALQDSFAHTIRSDDLTRIRHVLNYVDAIDGSLEESTDGLPHSDFMDTCEGEVSPIAMTASQASAALIIASNQALRMNSGEPVKAVLDEWITYEPGCTVLNDYCDSAWVALARRDQTGPYLEEFIGCDATAGDADMQSIFLVLTIGALLLVRRRRTVLVGAGVLLLFSSPESVRAQIFVQAESHVSLLSDAPERSILANTFGAGIRGGYAWQRWRAMLHVERNFWVSTELTDRTTGGVLNIGLGGQYVAADGFVRSSAVFGTSTLRYDTPIDEKGTTGIFFDLRPVELCWQPYDWLGITLTPLSFTYVSPVLKEPPIRLVLYRTTLGLETQL